MLNIGQYTNHDNLPLDGDYKLITFEYPAIKLGYCGDVLSIGKEIILTIEGSHKRFEIGKTGMFEYQPENISDINDPDAETREAIVYVTEVRVPADPTFVLDYCYQAS